VVRAEVKRLVRRRDAPALLDKPVGQIDQPPQPFRRDQPGGGQKPGLEIALALRLTEHARLVGEDILGRHGASFSSAYDRMVDYRSPVGRATGVRSDPRRLCVGHIAPPAEDAVSAQPLTRSNHCGGPRATDGRTIGNRSDSVVLNRLASASSIQRSGIDLRMASTLAERFARGGKLSRRPFADRDCGGLLRQRIANLP
jgi:hypothetical protein